MKLLRVRRCLTMLLCLTMLVMNGSVSAFAENENSEVIDIVKEETTEPIIPPTEKPTDKPTPVPTAVPTEVPTSAPTAVPTEVPTPAPTVESTAVPTEAPASVSTTVPTEVPTPAPIVESTAVPTEMPNPVLMAEQMEVPTEEPTYTPSDEVTTEPSEELMPALTAAPTVAQTEDLNDHESTEKPTEKPTDELEKETSSLSDIPFEQKISIDGIDITIIAEAGTFPQNASLFVLKKDNKELIRTAESLLNITSSDNVVVRHAVFQLSGQDMNGNARITLERLNLTDALKQYPEGKLSVHVIYASEENRIDNSSKVVPIETDASLDNLSFYFSEMGLFDVVTVVRLAPTEETLTTELNAEPMEESNENPTAGDGSNLILETNDNQDAESIKGPESELSEEASVESGSGEVTETAANLNDNTVGFYAFGSSSAGIVTVSAAPGVFPEAAQLVVSDPAPMRKKLKSSAADVKADARIVVASYSYEITVTDETGNIVQPAEGTTATITFQLAEANDKNLSVRVLHQTAEGQEELPVYKTENAVVAETTGFSKYTVEFYYNQKEYVMEGSSSILLSDILTAVGLEGEVTTAETSNEDLFSVINTSGKWIVTAHQAFDSTEWMNVTVNRITYNIIVKDSVFKSGNCGEHLTWTLDDQGVLTIDGWGEMTYSYSDDTCWNNYKNDITKIVLHNGITSIDFSAFNNCPKVTNIVVPESVTSIEQYAFAGCENLISVTILGNVTSIPQGTFGGCEKLTFVDLPASVTSIGFSVFYGDKNLRELSILDGLLSIDSTAFEKCRDEFGNDHIIKYAHLGSDGAKTLSKNGYPFRIPGKNYDLIYLYSGDTITGLEIRKIDEGVTSFTIPEGVTSIGHAAFPSSVTDVSIPDCVTNIENMAFANCKELKSITIPESVTSIKEDTFATSGLQSITLPQSLISIGNRAFNYCDQLHNIVIPENVTSIGREAFYNCSSLTGVSLPDGLTSIEICMFEGCSSLKEISIPNDVKYIGDSAFYDCSLLTAIEIPEGVTSIGKDAFRGCSNLMTVSIPASVTSIGSGLFYDCNEHPKDIYYGGTEEQWNALVNNISLGDLYFTTMHFASSILESGKCGENLNWTIDDHGTLIISGSGEMFNYTSQYISGKYVTNAPWGDNPVNLVVHDGASRIGDSAFYGCSKLVSVTIPESVTSIGFAAFESCEAISEIHIPSSDSGAWLSAWASIKCANYSSRPNGNGNAVHLVYNDEVITGIGLHDGVTSIEDYAFANCGITGISIPESVTYIGESAFRNCNLDVVNIPEGVVRIGKGAFNNCSDLYRVELPSSLTFIGQNAFQGCDKLRDVCISDVAAWLSINFETKESAPNFIGWMPENPLTLWIDGNWVTEIVIPDGVEMIPDRAFMGFTNIKNVFIPESVKSIGANAFDNCTDLETVDMPSGITKIADYTFHNCHRLSTVTIPEGVVSIGDHAFYQCDSLSEITIPQSVSEIRNFAFAYCRMLSDITIPNGVTKIGAHAFEGCSGITNVTIPKSLSAIESFAFFDCEGLESITIPNTITEISYYAFDECDNLEDVYYSGSKAEWNSVKISNNNDPLLNANIHFKNCTVLFYANEGSGSMEPAEVETGELYMLPECGFTAPEGKAFKEWSVKIGENEIITKSPDEEITVTEDTSITAVWSEVYTVTFESDGGSSVEPQTVLAGETIVKPDDPIKEGFSFQSWQLNGEDYDFASPVIGDITLNAVWTASNMTAVINSASVVFDGLIRIKYYFTIPEDLVNQPDAAIVFYKENTEIVRTGLSDGALVTEGSHAGQRTYYYDVFASEIRTDITVRIMDGSGTPVTLQSTGGTDYTEGFVYSAEAYAARMQQNGSEKMRPLAKALEDYGIAAKIYFGNGDTAGLTVSDAVTAITEENLQGYALNTTGIKPAGFTGCSISVMFEADNSLRIYFRFDGTKEPESYTYMCDTAFATLKERSDGALYLDVQNIAAKDLGQSHTFTITDGTDTYKVIASALSYALTSVKNGSEARQNLGKALFLYHQAALGYFN